MARRAFLGVRVSSDRQDTHTAQPRSAIATDERANGKRTSDRKTHGKRFGLQNRQFHSIGTCKWD